ncbi:myosin-7-like isoform X11 [Senna tora]|uniref:Myosin-7-like isoform X11 n=1 Tax=Senna tora TaxID=362788 RepID=A0A834X3N5_9FABA|nr:myosin-7-like isoform X11 [Senna tora]
MWENSFTSKFACMQLISFNANINFKQGSSLMIETLAIVLGVQATEIKFIVGSHVFVEDPEVAWIEAEILEVNGEELKVKCISDKVVVVKASNVHPKDPEFPPGGVDDMTRLAYLHEPGVLQNLGCRYETNEIYTYTGNILIAVNPFQRLPQLYGHDVMEKYKGATFGELSPHPFAIADSAYRMMINEGASQAILVSGESGAGKTESTKMLMHYLAYMGGRAASEGRSVEQQVLESNPVLEAFGNAKTLRNNNSSRFGKFVELQFDQRGRISGAAIRTYLLERSRVCQVSDPERNYHCFYMLCAAPEEDIKKYKLGNPRSYHYLNQSNFFELEGLDESKEYLATRRAMEVVGMSSDEQDAIFRVVAAVLHLGNIEFVKGDEPDSSEPKDDQSRFHLKTAAELFMCDEKALEDSLCKRVMVTRGEAITKWLDHNSAALSRDSLAKVVYSRLFDWIVKKINDSIGQDPDSKNLIGVLDIYGFESFKTNSFEQFCINLTNEKLQQHFNQHVFKMEQEEYTKEEINWSYIEFIDNQDVLDLVEKKPGGIIALLDEACMFPRSTHETFAEKLYQTFKDNKRFSKPKLSRTDFTICHYAGDVTYQTDFFLDKNKDYVVPEFQALLYASKCSFVSGLFPPPPEETTKSSKFSSIATQFKQQLQSLLETLSATEPHYIRCVKPNNLLKPQIFENINVLQQLQCGGVMEAIRISCAGYPTRKNFDEFAKRFAVLAPEVLKGCPDERTACERLLKKVNLEDYQVGKTKVFLRAGQMAKLDACRAEVLGKSATIIQSKVRSYYGRKGYNSLRMSAIQIQTICRAVSIQTGMRGMAARDELKSRRRTAATIVIQSHCRGYVAHVHHLRLKEAAIVIQCVSRGQMAQRELRMLIKAAKDTGALQAAKEKLEKEVEELNSCLQMEKQMRADIEQENAKLQSGLEETKALLNQEREANAKLQSALEETKANTQLQSALEETKAPVNQEHEENGNLQSALEEAKALLIQEREANAKLQSSLEETKALLIRDNEAAKIGVELNLNTQEFPVVDNVLITKLTAENEHLKALVKSLEKKTDETERKSVESNKLNEEQDTKELPIKEDEVAKEVADLSSGIQDFPVGDNELNKKLAAENEHLKAKVNSLEKKIEESNKLSEERLKQASEAETKIIELKMAMQRLEEKLSDIETEDQILRQQTLLSSSSRRLSGPLSFSGAQPVENGHHDPQSSPGKKYGTEADAEMRRSQNERQQESVDALLKCVAEEDLGFSEGKPVAAYTVYKCLLHWRSFEADKTSVFDRLIQLVGNAIEDQDNNGQMAYWLSNTSALLFLLQQSLRAPSAQKPPPPATSFFGRISQSFRSSTAGTALDTVRQVDAKYPALLFKQQLTAYVEKIYGIVRENLKKDLSPLLSSCIQVFFFFFFFYYWHHILNIICLCKYEVAFPLMSIQAPKTSKESQSNETSPPADSWQNIADCLTRFLNMMKENYISPVLVQKLLTQVFHFINVQLFNSLVSNQECCTCSNGEFVKSGLDELEKWCGEATEEYAASCWDELKHVRQAIGLLVKDEKTTISYDDLTNDICPVLSVHQLYKICTLYGDGSDNTQCVSADVTTRLKLLMSDDANEDSSSFLLDDNSSIPCSVDEISNALHGNNSLRVQAPAELLKNAAFQFLHDAA